MRPSVELLEARDCPSAMSQFIQARDTYTAAMASNAPDPDALWAPCVNYYRQVVAEQAAAASATWVQQRQAADVPNEPLKPQVEEWDRQLAIALTGMMEE